MENVQKIKIKLENIWIDLIRSIYAPYRDTVVDVCPNTGVGMTVLLMSIGCVGVLGLIHVLNVRR